VNIVKVWFHLTWTDPRGYLARICVHCLLLETCVCVCVVHLNFLYFITLVALVNLFSHIA
jgi:hypothetical protein